MLLEGLSIALAEIANDAEHGLVKAVTSCQEVRYSIQKALVPCPGPTGICLQSADSSSLNGTRILQDMQLHVE